MTNDLGVDTEFITVPFPESYNITPNTAQSYKQIGNSVSVPVIALLAKEMVKHL